MTLRTATSADYAAIVAFYNTTPLASVIGSGTVADIAHEMARAGTKFVLNITGGTITACVAAFPDTTSRDPRVFVQFVMAMAVADFQPVLKSIAVTAIGQGYKDWYTIIPQASAYNTIRAYFEARWPYFVGDDEDGLIGRTKLMGGSLASIGTIG